MKPNLTPAQASARLIAKANEISAAQRVPFNTAWNDAKSLLPDEYAILKSADEGKFPRVKPAFTLANGKPAPSVSPEQAARLGLAADTDQQEFDAIWKATKGSVFPRDVQAIFDALVRLHGAREKACDEIAARMVLKRHPALAKTLGKASYS